MIMKKRCNLIVRMSLLMDRPKIAIYTTHKPNNSRLSAKLTTQPVNHS
jgi:hypothetical protein